MAVFSFFCFFFSASLLCNVELEADAAPKYIQSPNYPNYYSRDENCSWVISSPDFIELEVTDFSFDSGSADQVWLYDGPNENQDDFVAYMRDRFDDNGNPKTEVGRMFYSSGSFYRVKFFTDSIFEYGRGFRIRYQRRATQGPDVPIGAIMGGVMGGVAVVIVVVISSST